MSFRHLTDAAGKTILTVDVGNYLVPTGTFGNTLEQTQAYFDYIPNFKCRDDDVMLLSYPKTGTNWLNDVMGKLLSRSTEKVKYSKLMAMLEFQPQENVDKITAAPRVLNTHVSFRFLPKELKEKQLKTVLVVRNPKDMLVSYFNHLRGFRIYGYDGTWKDWFQLYMEGEMEYGLYEDYLKEFEQAMEEGIGYPFHVIHYEDLKMNGLQEIKKLGKFLGVTEDEQLFKDIMESCSFDRMVKENPFPDEFKKKMFTDGFTFFRKGQIGDWQNWFTVAQNEQFDVHWAKQMADSKFKFTYTQSTTP